LVHACEIDDISVAQDVFLMECRLFQFTD
jgi:hypothetical protein